MQQPGARQAKAAPSAEAAETALFSHWAEGYASERFGQPIAVLLAGAVTAAGDLGAASLSAAGADLSVGLVDDDQPVTRAAVGSHPGLNRCALGDLRTVIAEHQPLGGLAGGLRPPPRGYLAAQKLVAALSRGRLTAAHEELLYVMRKPENRFARIL